MKEDLLFTSSLQGERHPQQGEGRVWPWPESAPSGRQSFPTERIDQFWSHSWHGSVWRKVATAIYLNNGRMAALIATLGSMIVATLVAYGVLPDMNFGGPEQPPNPNWPLWCLKGGFVVHCLVLIFWRPRQRIFLDILCIDQEDDDLKGAALVSMGAFLKSSDAMVVFWDPSFTRRLWCVCSSWPHFCTAVHLTRPQS